MKTQAVVMIAGLAISGTATASSPFQVVDPASNTLVFHQVVAGVPTAPQPIHLRNTSAAVASGDARCCSNGFTMEGALSISASPGDDITWELTCLTDDAAGAQTYFDLDYCGASCNDVSGTLTIQATCSPPVMALTQHQLAFPTNPASVLQQETFTISNLTDAAVTWPLAVTGAGYTLVGDTAVSLPAGGSASITVAFRPSDVGDHPGTLSIGATGDPDHYAMPLTGIAAAPRITSDSVLAFDDVTVGASATAMLAIHNLEPGTSFRVASVTSDDPVFTATLPDDSTLAPGATLMVRVQFAPTALGAHAAQLAVGLDGTTAPATTIMVSGHGTDASGGATSGCNAAPGAGLGLALLGLLRRRRRSSPVLTAGLDGRS